MDLSIQGDWNTVRHFQHNFKNFVRKADVEKSLGFISVQQRSQGYEVECEAEHKLKLLLLDTEVIMQRRLWKWLEIKNVLVFTKEEHIFQLASIFYVSR